MLMSLLSHLLSAYFCFVLPSYSTFKALSHRPLSEQDLVRWSMYWSCVGMLIAFEYVAEWFISSVLPFYWEIKTMFLLFLALPQTQGSTYIYQTYLQPFFSQHETEIDSGILDVQTNMVAFLQARVVSLWDFALRMANETPANQQQSNQGQAPAGNSLSFESALGLLNTYGSSVIGALKSNSAPSNVQSAQATNVRPSPTPAGSSSSLQFDSRDTVPRRAPPSPGLQSQMPNPHEQEYQSYLAPSFPEPERT